MGGFIHGWVNSWVGYVMGGLIHEWVYFILFSIATFLITKFLQMSCGLDMWVDLFFNKFFLGGFFRQTGVLFFWSQFIIEFILGGASGFI